MTDTDDAGRHYTIISADTHAGASHAMYREFLESKYHEQFDAWRGEYKNPFNDLGDELTLRVKPQKTGLLIAGVTLAVFLIGIPMWIAATPKVWASPGRPGGNLSFRRLKKAR